MTYIIYNLNWYILLEKKIILQIEIQIEIISNLN